MNARPEVKRVLITKRMQHWLRIAQYNRLIHSNYKPADARRNFLRLLARYPDLGRQLGYSIASAYE